ncbi:uncharacterized protein LTR77_006192 [Saxophila tyrrhenica]|uniref:Complex I intermediate-associated protein 84 n=1 Tax=Saxophila tyrrhenica TaxID=1690608 RepID=A0AAV9P7M6_9PEZI|nr:hypothetical protein LTR77_006192 [Saxophila tyrrhenica]
MPSHLTRSVFRRLLADQPIIHRACLRRRRYCSLAPASALLGGPTRQHVVASIPHRQRRHFLNFNIFGSKREAKEPDMDPGIDKMMELAKRQRMDARMPSVEDALEAVRLFLKHKRRKDQPITDSQARLVHQSLQYCFESIDALPMDGEHVQRDAEELRSLAREVAKHLSVTTTRTTASNEHVQFLWFLYSRASSHGFRRLKRATILPLVHMLSLTGSSHAARDLVLQHEPAFSPSDKTRQPAIAREEEGDQPDLPEDDRSTMLRLNQVTTSWATVLNGFVTEKNVAEVHSTMEMIQQRKCDNHRNVPRAMLLFAMQQKDPEALKHWWMKYRSATADVNERKVLQDAVASQFYEVLMWCLKENQLQLGHEVVRGEMAKNPLKPCWDAVFVWAAGTKKSVDEIGRMMTVMEKSNEDIADREAWRQPDVVTINALVDFAVSQNDPYMAERFIALGRERNIEPNARTFALQMDYRLSVGDVDGALVAYKGLVEHRNAQIEEESFTEDVGAINRLIVALSGTQRHDFDTIMNVAMDLADRRAPFEANTVSTLALLHLARDEEDDATDLLNTHSYHFASTERTHVRDEIVKFALDPKTPTRRAWQSYNIIRDIFDETPRDQRTELMTSFFNRERADMGVRVFQHMRAHSRADTIPTVDTYVAIFMGLAKLRDIDSVEIVHNLLKLDFNITVTTYLRNALIIAYTAGDKGRKALGFWDDIVKSKEGPSYNSIHVALRACENSPFGDLRAKELWSLLRRRNVELDQPLWASYVAALAGNGDNDTAISTVEEAEANGQLDVEVFLLGSLMGGANGQMKQEEIEAWAKEKYSAQWEELERLGFETDIAGTRTFNIDRRVSP